MSKTDLAEHLRFFAELGVEGISRDPLWRRRVDRPPDATSSAQDAAASDEGADDQQGGRTSGVPVPMLTATSVMAASTPTLVQADGSREALAIIRADIGDCTRCKLHTGRTNLVFGVGNPAAELMFVGEGPGADEDLQGEPFVGRAGQLLTKIIEAMGYARSDVYIANVVKCRPPNNRNPEPDEIARCEPFLLQQIDAIRPRAIVALGKFAAQSLLQTTEPISRLRGRFHPFRNAQVMPTFHPSYLLRTPGAKREVWDDMKKVLTLLGREIPRSGGSGS